MKIGFMGNPNLIVSATSPPYLLPSKVHFPVQSIREGRPTIGNWLHVLRMWVKSEIKVKCGSASVDLGLQKKMRENWQDYGSQK